MVEEFRKLLNSINRDGMNNLINFIEKTDVYTAPASTRFHGSYDGGLLEHSMKVYEILKHKVEHSIKIIFLNISCKGLKIILILLTIKFIINQLDLVFIK